MRISRDIVCGFGALGFVVALLAAFLFLVKPVGAQTAAAGPVTVGVATCESANCHGKSAPQGPVVRQDEVAVWRDASSPAGAHSRAFQVLGSARAQDIARRLGLPDASRAEQCLGCHVTPGAQRGPRFDVAEGVGCEGCHGAAGGWLDSHAVPGTAHADNVRRGMRALEVPRVRASVCLDCHLGSDDRSQFASHRLMAAGHPRLAFELDLFTTLQAHHLEDADYFARKGRPNAVRTWAVGQAAALERSLTLFTATGRGMDGMFPEASFFDCQSCHRPATRGAAAAANPGRPVPIGMPVYNDENMIMLSAAAQVAAPQLGARFEQDSRAFHAALASDRISAVRAAAALRESARALAAAFAAAPLDRAQTFAIVEAIASDAIAQRFTDHGGAVQAVMAVDTLLSALVSNGHVPAARANAIRGDINLAYQAVHAADAHDLPTFRTALSRAAAAIGGLR